MGLDLKEGKCPKNGSFYKEKFKKGTVVRDVNTFLGQLIGDNPVMVEVAARENGDSYCILSTNLYVSMEGDSFTEESITSATKVLREVMSRADKKVAEAAVANIAKMVINVVGGEAGDIMAQVIADFNKSKRREQS